MAEIADIFLQNMFLLLIVMPCPIRLGLAQGNFDLPKLLGQGSKCEIQ